MYGPFIFSTFTWTRNFARALQNAKKDINGKLLNIIWSNRHAYDRGLGLLNRIIAEGDLWGLLINAKKIEVIEIYKRGNIFVNISVNGQNIQKEL